MQTYSTQTAGFVALTVTELLLQECVLKGVLSEKDVKRLLRAAARRHENAAEGEAAKIDLNMQAAHMIRALMSGLEPLFEKKKKQKKRKKKKLQKTRNFKNCSLMDSRDAPG